MAVGPDRVQVLKQESAALGGDSADDVPWASDPIAPQEDAIESAGVYFQDALNRDEAVYIERDGTNMRFVDQVNTAPLTLSELRHNTASTQYRRTFFLMGA